MNPMVTQAILQDRKITYVVTDHNLNVVEIGDTAGLFSAENYDSIQGQSLLKLVPELVGSESALRDILAGKLPRFELPWINFEMMPGQTIYLNLVNLPHRNARGQITGLIHLVQDVTDMGQVHQQLAQHRNELRLLQEKLARQNQELAAANAELRRLDEIKSTFISVAAHELNTPLSSIIGFLEMVLDDAYGPVSEDHQEPLSIVYRSSQRLATIISDLLDVTRIESGRVALALKPTDLADLVETAAAEFEPQLNAKEQNLHVDIQPNLPFALCDPVRAMQIISNLVGNAGKYTPAGGDITLSLIMAEEEGFLQFAVADTGVGIAAKDQPNMFRRFFRAGSANLTGEKGTGLGLYITRSLVDLHGGRIWFESELNKGSTFYVTFPIAGEPL